MARGLEGRRAAGAGAGADAERGHGMSAIAPPYSVSSSSVGRAWRGGARQGD